MMAAAAWASRALAADGHEAPKLEDKIDWIVILITGLGVVAIAAIAFKNARRTHLD